MIIGDFQELLHQIAHRPLASLSIIINLVLIESLLSVDNAAVLATMVLDLPKAQRSKALRYGILGAYIFRGLSLFFASVLISIWWFKPLGGLYLIYLAVRWFFRTKKKNPVSEAGVLIEKKKSRLYRSTLGAMGPFWATVVMVELMDAAFSIDNVIAANAYSRNIILIWTGVFIGILAMRFVTQGFVRLMERYPFLEGCAYLVILMLGIKLMISGLIHFYPCSSFAVFMEGKNECLVQRGIPLQAGTHQKAWGDLLTSVISLCLFLVPIITSLLFNRPRHHNREEKKG